MFRQSHRAGPCRAVALLADVSPLPRCTWHRVGSPGLVSDQVQAEGEGSPGLPGEGVDVSASGGTQWVAVRGHMVV